MKETLLEMLKTYLGDDYDENIVSICADRAIKSFIAYMNYPTDMKEIAEGEATAPYEDDLVDNEYCLFDLALFFLGKQGIEFESSHEENGAKLAYESEATIYSNHGVIPYATIL